MRHRKKRAKEPETHRKIPKKDITLMKTLNVPAQIEYLEEILTMVDEFLHPADVPDEISMKIRISVEEIFTNIVSPLFVEGFYFEEIL